MSYQRPSGTGWVTLFANHDQTGDHSTFYYDSDNSYLNQLTSGFSYSFNSIDLPNNTWLVIYNERDFKGQCQLYSSSVDRLSDEGLSTKGYPLDKHNQVDYNKNWKGNIKSLRLYNYAPLNPNTITKNFLRIYQNLQPGVSKPVWGESDGNYYISFDTQDVEFRVYYPEVWQVGNTLNISLQVRQCKGGPNNIADIRFNMDLSTGKYTGDMSITYTMGDFGIPKWLIKGTEKLVKDAVDDAIITMVDGAEEEATDGAATPALIDEDEGIHELEDDFWNDIGDDLISKGTSFAADHINKMVKKVAKKANKGGIIYFPSVVKNAITRITYACIQQINNNWVPKTTFYIDYDLLAWNIYNNGNKSCTQSSFSNKAYAGGKYNNNATTYIDSNNSYVLFKPDYSPGYAQTGMLSSCNIAMTGNHHLSLDLGFDAMGKLFSIQGTIFDVNAPRNTNGYEYPSSGIITYDKFGNIIIVPTDSSTAELVYDFGKDTLDTGGTSESETLAHGAYYQDSCNTLLKAYVHYMQQALDNTTYSGKDYSSALENSPRISKYFAIQIIASVKMGNNKTSPTSQTDITNYYDIDR